MIYVITNEIKKNTVQSGKTFLIIYTEFWSILVQGLEKQLPYQTWSTIKQILIFFFFFLVGKYILEPNY